MVYHLAALAVLWSHLAFVAFVLFGACLALRWRWIPLLHLPAAAWGVFVEWNDRLCPLTDLENLLLELAGQRGYPESFTQHYLLWVIYPEGLTRGLQMALAALLVAVNLALYRLLWRRWRRARAGRRTPPPASR